MYLARWRIWVDSLVWLEQPRIDFADFSEDRIAVETALTGMGPFGEIFGSFEATTRASRSRTDLLSERNGRGLRGRAERASGMA
jgi:hypothetical protein